MAPLFAPDVTFENGIRRSLEIAAGDGYLSQSAPLLNIAIPDGSKAAGVEVRWPDGTSTKTAGANISQKLEIQQ